MENKKSSEYPPLIKDINNFIRNQKAMEEW